MSQLGIWSITDAGPVRSDKVRIGLEGYLEDWIERDPRMLSDDLTIVGRQIWLSGHRLDLLAIRPTGQWVVIELKESSLYRETLMQALDYCSKIATMSAEELLGKLNRGGDAARAQAEVHIAGELEGDREVVAMLVGTVADPGLERMAGFLSGFKVPIEIVTFDVFEADGVRLLVREVEDPVDPGGPNQTAFSEAAVRGQAAQMGGEEILGELIQAGRNLGLHVRPWMYSITLTPPDRGKRTLFFAKPKPAGHLQLGWHPNNITNLYPLTQADVDAALGRFENWATFGPSEVRAFVAAMGDLMGRAQGDTNGVDQG